MERNPNLVKVPKDTLDRVLKQYPNHVESCEVVSDEMTVTVYRLKEMKRVIGLLGENPATGNVVECKVSEAFL